MAFTEDYTDFLSDFASTASWNSTTISGILDKQYIESGMIQGNAPTFLVKTSDISAIAQGQSITIASVAYTIREYHADGAGMTLLILELV